MDYAKVTKQWKHFKPRPGLSNSMNVKVEEALEEHKQAEEQKKDPTKPQRKEKDITEDERDDKIAMMFEYSSQMVGLAPITKHKNTQAMNNMTRRGVFNPKENFEQRRNRTVKSLVKSWARTNLQVTEQEWSTIDIKEIIPTITEDSDIIFFKVLIIR